MSLKKLLVYLPWQWIKTHLLPLAIHTCLLCREPNKALPSSSRRFSLKARRKCKVNKVYFNSGQKLPDLYSSIPINLFELLLSGG